MNPIIPLVHTQTLDIKEASEEDRFREACTYAESNLSSLLEHLDKFALTEDYRFQLASILTKKNPFTILNHLDKFALIEDYRFQLAAIIAEENPYSLTNDLDKFTLSENHRFQLAAIIAKKYPYFIPDHLDKFALHNEYYLFQLASIFAEKDPSGLLNHLDKFALHNEYHLFQLASILAEKKPSDFLNHLDRFALHNENHLFQLASILAEKNPSGLLNHLDKFALHHENHLFQLASTLAKKDPSGLLNDLDKFKLHNEDDLFQIASMVAEKDPSTLLHHLNTFAFLSEDYRLKFIQIIEEAKKESFKRKCLLEKQNYRVLDQYIIFAQYHITEKSNFNIVELKKIIDEMQEIATNWKPKSVYTLELFKETIELSKAKIDEREQAALTWIKDHLRDTPLKSIDPTEIHYTPPVKSFSKPAVESTICPFLLESWNQHLPSIFTPGEIISNINDSAIEKSYSTAVNDIIALCLRNKSWHCLIPLAYQLKIMSSPVDFTNINKSLYAILLDKNINEITNQSFYEGDYTITHIPFIIQALHNAKKDMHQNDTAKQLIEEIICSLSFLDITINKQFIPGSQEEILSILYDKDVTFPILYPLNSDGHAMLLQIKKDGFIIYNTGEGIEHHYQKPDSDPFKNHFQTYLEFLYPPSENPSEKTLNMITQCTKIAPTASHVYEFLSTLGTRVPCSTSDVDYEQIQANSTCSAQCIMACIRHHILTHAPGDDKERLALYKTIKALMLSNLVSLFKGGISEDLKEAIESKHMKYTQMAARFQKTNLSSGESPGHELQALLP